MKKVVIYARVSTAEQAEEGYSIDAQLKMVTEKCIQEGRVVIDTYVDRGISGKSIKNRLALQQLLDDLSKREFSEVWVWKTNRLARNHLDLMNIVNLFEKYDVGFKSCTEPFETSTPSGKLLLNLLASIGEFERETIVENVKMGMKERAKSGKWNGGRVLGYDSIKVNELDEKNSLIINENEAIVVRLIYRLYLEGNGLKAITNKINKMGYKSKKGNFFSVSAIKEILRNPIYCGLVRYNYRQNWNDKRRKGINPNPIIVEGEHEAIIKRSDWENVQILYKSKSKKPSRVFDGEYLLTGLLKCPVCGASMVAGRVKTKNKKGEVKTIRYYHCGNWKNKGTSVCRSNGIRADKAEEYVLNLINKAISNKQILEIALKKLSEKKLSTVEPLKKELNIIEDELKHLKNRYDKTFILYEDDIIDKQSLKERLKSIEQNIELHTNRKKEINEKLDISQTYDIDMETVNIIIEKFNNIIFKVDKKKQKEILHLMIDSINTNKDRKIESINIKFNDEINKSFMQVNGGEPLIGSSLCFYIQIQEV